jgi:hypothetical protein
VSVAAGTPCLRRFPVPRSGRVLLYAAEDALHIVRQRLEGICAAAGHALAALDVQVITAPTVRLDLAADRQALDETVVKLAPAVLNKRNLTGMFQNGCRVNASFFKPRKSRQTVTCMVEEDAFNIGRYR